MLLKFDFVRLCHYIGEINCKKTVDEVKERNELVRKLRVSRYGNIDTSSHVVNLSSYQLSNIETEVLSRGLKFAIPPQKVKREAVLSEFESLWAQLENLSPESNEAVAACKAKLSDIAHAYSGTPIDCKDFSLTREHLIALANLRKNKNLIICKPDKGSGVVILDSCDYNAKMMQILGNKEKFCTIGSIEKHERTSVTEKRLQTQLRNLKASNQITQEFYDKVRPVGSERPRMYGLPKIHKQGTPLRPILSMIKSAQHSLAKELSLLLEPVLNKFSTNVLKDSFTFADELRSLSLDSTNLVMCSFDVVSLFTNIPLDETIQICIDTLYHTDITPPPISEEAFHELIISATKGVEFSFGDTMFKQIDGVAMGSPLGPVLANIFVGCHETKLFNESCPDKLPKWYKRFVDDTFSLFPTIQQADAFLSLLNGMHPSLKFTCELEQNGKLPFLDILIHREDKQFLTSIYHKPTFTGLYTRFDSFSPKRQKLALVKCLINRTRRLSSNKFLDRDLKNLKSIFLSNGYPGRLLDKLFCTSSNNTDNFIGPQKCPVYLKLPWIGQIAETHFERELKNITEKTFRSAKLRCIFSTRTILAPTPKDSLPAFSTSSVIYEFKCECDSRYVGRTSQRLGDRVKQHIPSTIRNQTLPMRKQPGRKCRQNQEIECDSAIGKHLLMNKSCADAYSDDKFRILQKCRSTFSLKTMEAIFIKLNDPVLCRQKQFVFQLALF